MNGTNSIYIKSFHGVYRFELQRFTDNTSCPSVSEINARNYFDAVNIYTHMTEHHESHELCRYRSKYCNLLPYRKLKEVIDIQIGDIGYSTSQLQKRLWKQQLL